MAAHIHANQKLTGDQILDLMFTENRPHTLLLAQMQMGKTGTYWHVILEALLREKTQRVFIISGNREKELRAQVKQDRLAYTLQHSRSLRKRIRILWGSALTRAELVPPNSLIVWDEAHYAQSLINAPFRFFERNELEGLLNGSDSRTAIERNIRLLTVSATPFSELLSKLEDPHHCMVRLVPSESYFGVGYYLREGRVHPSFEMKEDHRECLRALLERYADKARYMIIRLMDTTRRYRMVHELCQELGIRTEVLNCQRRSIEVGQLAERPERATAVLISGMLRMGKVLPKRHVSMVFEEKTPKNTKHADTGLQGLWGRVCGHSEAPFDIDVYIEESMIDYAQQYVESYDAKEGPLCKPAMNVRKREPDESSASKKTLCRALEEPPKSGTRSQLIKHAIECFPDLEGMNFSVKDLEKKTHRCVYRMLLEGSCSRNVEANACHLYKRYVEDQYEAWVVIADSSQPPEIKLTDRGLVNDKCVFKPK